MASPKDVHHFGRDLVFRGRGMRDRKAYEALFAGATDERRIGQSAVWYLYSRTAAEEIREYAPDALIIVMLREPAQMLYSQHSQFLYNGNEDIGDFAEALAAEPDRRNGRRIPPSAHFVEGLFYRATVDYAPQVERYFKAFGRDRVHVILHEDLRRDPATTFGKTLEFLGVDPEYRPPAFGVINPNKQLRSSWLRRMMREQPGRLSVVGRVIPRPARHWLRRRLRTLNRRYVPRPPLDRLLEAQLRREFKPSVTALEELTGLDLHAWYDALA